MPYLSFPWPAVTPVGQPILSGWEAQLAALRPSEPLVPSDYSIIRAGFACALHMHQPTIPAGHDGRLISHLQYMLEHPHEGDNHNAQTFLWCYQRMGDWIPELVAEGCQPRIMLDYSGNLLWGLQQMGQEGVLDALRRITVEATYAPYVEWLGTCWGHAVIPSTPIPDIELHLRAWQHQFVALFGVEALQRVQGFSLPEMHLPNHPDTLFTLVECLKRCGYRWLLVQEHSVEQLDGSPLSATAKYVPNRLVARNSQGEVSEITVLIKTQGSDTKLVAQMQPYHEAKHLATHWSGAIAPPCVTQIADGENGGVMMNEYPRDFMPVWHELKAQAAAGVVGLNGSEYLTLLAAKGITAAQFPRVQAVQQHKLWQYVDSTSCTPEAVAVAIAQLSATDPHFSMAGTSWTNHISWVKGYETVLQPMEQLSREFHRRYDPLVAADPQITQTAEYQEALLYLLTSQTSCFRYWGSGRWTEYAKTICERGLALCAAN
ncbi:glycosyl hydrolase family 57 [Synechococcus sp. PCC 6716]|nr:glycosyl hydrolase family 57 [Synechococcus sp. PCC 6716]